MIPFCLLVVSVVAASPLLGWTESGPERGHVMDLALRGNEVRALTRIGVIVSSGELDGWERDPRFPVNTRQIAAVEKDATFFANTPTSIFHLGDELVRLGFVPKSGVVVALESLPDGNAIVGVRSEQGNGGVWLYPRGGTPKLLLGEVDPWAIRVTAKEIWVATLDKGVWSSRDNGVTFKARSKEGVSSALGFWNGEVVVGWEGGRITDATGEQLRCKLPDGTAISMVEIDKTLFAVADTSQYPFTHLYACAADGTARFVQSGSVDEDVMPFQPTAIWPFNEQNALVGTFRAGPALVGPSGLTVSRRGFHATLGTAVHQVGNTLLAGFMSTGVYTTKDEGKSWVNVIVGSKSPIGIPPVSDTTDLYLDGERIVVLDFDGITTALDSVWTRTPGVDRPMSGRRNALVEISPDARGRVWARDFAGGLWLRNDDEWQECATTGVIRMDGRGSDLILATANAYFLPQDCDEVAEPAWNLAAGQLSPAQSRGLGEWVLAPGGLWRKGVKILDMPDSPVQGLAVRTGEDGEPEVLAAMTDQPLLRCTPRGCEAVATALPGPLEAVGWFESGRIWALEKRGSFLLTGLPTDVGLVRKSEAAVSEDGERAGHEFQGPPSATQLEIPPWRQLGKPNFQDRENPDGAEGAAKQLGAPQAAAEEESVWGWVLAVEAAAVAAVVALMVRSRRSKPGPSRRRKR